MSDNYRVKYTMTGYAIIGPDGRMRAERYGNRDSAETRCTALEKALKDGGRKKRPCITCGTEILSEGPHHRMCTPCRSNASDVPYVFGPRRGRAGVRS